MFFLLVDIFSVYVKRFRRVNIYLIFYKVERIRWRKMFISGNGMMRWGDIVLEGRKSWEVVVFSIYRLLMCSYLRVDSILLNEKRVILLESKFVLNLRNIVVVCLMIIWLGFILDLLGSILLKWFN